MRFLDQMYANAFEDGKVDEIHNAVDHDGDAPLHIACEFGHPEVVEWILSKQEMKADVNSLNNNDLTPLFLVCIKGYVGAEGIGSKTQLVKQKRLKIAKLLAKEKCEINTVRAKVDLTPLHWAAYNNDEELCRFLLHEGANQIESG